MQERYGAAKPRRRALLIVATTILATVFLGWLAWAVWFHSNPAIEAEVTRYEITGVHDARVQVAARIRDDEVRGSCLVRATASDHTIVGELNLSVSDLREQQGRWIPLRTERKATAVELVRCTEHGS
jgi:hypothetical protein